MKESKLLNLVSVLFVICHFLILMLVVALGLIGWLSTEMVKICLPIIIPLFITHTTLIVTYYTVQRENTQLPSRMLNGVYSFFSIFIPVLFVIMVAGVIINQPFNPLSKDDFAFYLGLGETIFGVTMGMQMKSLFALKNRMEDAATPNQPKPEAESI